MINEALQKKLVQKILDSKEFTGSKIYQNYLTYLVEATNRGENPKETTIAIEVFGKDSNFNPGEDTIVRSHMYSLRKKLDSYYLTEGKDDKYVLKIPKGHYQTHFVPAGGDKILSPLLFSRFANRYSFLLIALLFAIIIFQWLHIHNNENKLKNYQVVEKNDPIWKDYLQSDLPVLIVLGNHFFFNVYNDVFKDTVSIRNPRVNSAEDFMSLYPNLTLTPAPEPYFPYHSVWSMASVLSVFNSVHKTPILRKSSDIFPQILNEYNIIFLGSIKTLYRLKHTLHKSHFSYEISPHKVIYTLPDSNIVKTYETSRHSQGPNEDLVLALKLPGPDKNSIMIIASYHSLGAPEIVNYLINPVTRKIIEDKFIEKYKSMPQYFEILFRVTGIDKTAYSTEILVYNKLAADND
ncbi:MAG TPA: hypothetical protein PLP19_11350 [bacterium]|nr:hypothetical protein [bacterium]HPN44077.1 hypothetical protein [bacterium]